MKRKVLILGVLLVAGGLAASVVLARPQRGPLYRTAKVSRGRMRILVTATGQVQPFLQVQVGTQITGTVQKLFVDFNSSVKRRQQVAVIDPEPYQSIVNQDTANLIRAQADVGRVRATLTQAEKDLERSRQLAAKQLISVSDLDAAVAAYETLAAQLRVAEAVVDQSKAALEQSRVNLDYTTIVSPIDGVVLSRNVDVGQTLAASLSAPTIYVIADEMKTIQVQASVAEADIGSLHEGQRVSFRVDAYPEMTFLGKVSQIRLMPTTVQNVVTYTVMIDADNPDRKLLPGMTANVSFEIMEFRDTIRIPNAALRFVPPGEHEAPREKAGTARAAAAKIWRLRPEGPEPLSVTPGVSDGTFTQLVKGDIHEGDDLIIAFLQDAAGPWLSNPFAPALQGGRR
jgi:HlyD family secretion protein